MAQAEALGPAGPGPALPRRTRPRNARVAPDGGGDPRKVLQKQALRLRGRLWRADPQARRVRQLERRPGMHRRLRPGRRTGRPVQDPDRGRGEGRQGAPGAGQVHAERRDRVHHPAPALCGRRRRQDPGDPGRPGRQGRHPADPGLVRHRGRGSARSRPRLRGRPYAPRSLRHDPLASRLVQGYPRRPGRPAMRGSWRGRPQYKDGSPEGEAIPPVVGAPTYDVEDIPSSAQPVPQRTGQSPTPRTWAMSAWTSRRTTWRFFGPVPAQACARRMARLALPSVLDLYVKNCSEPPGPDRAYCCRPTRPISPSLRAPI